jgi:NAD-specific glutamate dehydrogenase
MALSPPVRTEFGPWRSDTFDLRQAARRGPDAFEPEVTERTVVAREFTLALQHVNVHRRLVVFSRREGFRFARRT